MKNIYRFLFALAPSKFYVLALAFCLAISACGLEEPYNNSSDKAGVIEFVPRQIGYNNQSVDTKSAANDFEKEIHNCFFLLFDNATGARINTPVNLVDSDVTTLPTQLVKLDKVNATSVTACFIANVPSDFVSNIIGLDRPNTVEDTEANNQKYLNSAVLSGITYGTGNNFGKPLIDLDGATGNNDAVACIPMLGTQEIILSSANNSIQVPLKRLFAKVTVDLKLDMDLSDWNNVIQTYTYLQVNYYELRNMPNRVRLIESTEQSAWVTDPKFDAFVTSEISSGTINKQIYNKNSNTSNNKSCIFEFYAPEYYLNRVSDWTNDEKSKPNNKPANAKAIYLFLDATYSQYSLTTTDLQYEIYLGRDEVSDFSLARNVNYINTLTVKGIDKSDVDHRVSTTVINNPVAKEAKSANCYIIGKVGQYYFPAYKGAFNDLTQADLCSNPKAKLVPLANDNERNIVLEDLVYDVDKNIVSFYVSKIADGNVIIALVDDNDTETTEDDEIEWSWHLWCSPTSSIDVFGWGDMKTQTYNGCTFMDRNLGATSAASAVSDGIGLYYKYGNKNPFIGGKYQGGGQNGSQTWLSQEESTNADGDVLVRHLKTVNDPCPPGYMVAPKNSWNTGSGAIGTSSLYFMSSLDPLVYLYYSGYLYYDSSTKKYTTTTSYEEDNDYMLNDYSMEPLDLDIIPSYINQVGGTWDKVKTRTKVETVTIYYDFEYKAKTQLEFGDFWYTNGELYRCFYSGVDWTKILENAFTVTKCKTLSYKEYQDQKSTNYGVSYKDEGDPYYGDYEYGTKTSGMNLYAARIYNQVRGKNLLGSDSKHMPTYDNGCQIRCVQEK